MSHYNIGRFKNILLNYDLCKIQSCIIRVIQRQILNRKRCISSTNYALDMQQYKFYSSSANNQRLIVNMYGDPKEVVIKEPYPVPTIQSDNQVLVKFLAAPVNPADINTIQGVYAIKPDFPFIPGNEAVMEVVEVAKGVKTLSAGDKVIPCLNAMGTWRSTAVVSEDELLKIPPDIDIVTAATIAVNPCTAYRMLKDFVSLKEGDVIIQNCANSAVGQAAVQIAASKGILTINIIRNRPDLDNLKLFLKGLGATLVITDEELRTSKVMKNLSKPVLALNGVSGRPATEMLRQLANGGTMVTYGGMSKQPVTAPVGSLIFNDLILRGFWMTRWNQNHVRDKERMSMFEDLFKLVREGKLKPPPHTLVPLDDYQTALNDAMPTDGKIGKKQILTFL